MEKSGNGDGHGDGKRVTIGMRKRAPGKLLRIAIGTFKRLEFGRHCLDRMDQRGITQEEVLEAIQNPDEDGLKTQPGRKRVRKFKKGGEAVDVVYKEIQDKILVVTTFAKKLRR